MYHPEIVKQFLAQQKQATPGFKGIYHSISDVDAMTSLLADAWDPDDERYTRKLTAEEVEWIDNERLLCTHDFNYYCSRYFHVKDFETERLTRLKFNIAQRIVIDCWAEMEAKRWAIMMMQLKARRLGVCLHPRTLVLSADLRWIPIEELTVGQALVTCEEFPRLGKGASRKLCVGWVEAKRDVFEPSYEILLENGQKLIATGLHRFLSRVRGAVHTEWRQVRHTQTGDYLRTICQPWGSADYEDGWFGGMIDGEGSLRGKDRAGSELCVAQRPGPVFERLKSYIKKNGYVSREDMDTRTREHSPSKLSDNPVGKVVVGRLSDLFKIIGQCRPTRFLNSSWWEGKELPGKRGQQDHWKRVVSIRILGEQRMIDLQTSTKTFIAEGFVSHNSTVSAAAVAHRMQFHADTASIVASSTPAKSNGLVKIMSDGWDQMPWWLMPKPSMIQDGFPIQFRGHNATLSIQAGNQFTGIGRGSSPSVIWLSEVCEWRDPYADIDSALIRAILETERTFFILESTALGRGNWYHNRWTTSKERYGSAGGQFYPMFLPFYVGTDIYPTPAWLRRRPVPSTFTPDDKLIAYARRCEGFVSSHPMLQKYLGSHWVMPIEQLWWYYATREEYRQNDNLNQFLAECCSDDLDAFQSTNRSAFSQDIIQVYHDRLRPPLGVFKLVGLGPSEEEVPEKMRPTSQEIDQSKPPINIPCRWGQYDGRFQLMPIHWRGSSASAFDGCVFIYEMPRDDHEYCFGVDCAEGIGADRTVVEMIRRDSLTEPDAQVCEWASAWVNQMEAWPWCMAIGTFYSTMYEGSRRQAKSAIEVRIQGDAIQWALRTRGWMNHLVWPRALDNKKVDMSHMTKLGFVTNAWSRPYAIGLLLKYINREYIQIHSPYLIEEMEAFSKADDETKMQAEHGEHDDRLMAMSFALFALHVMEHKSGRFTVAEAREALSSSPDPVYDPGWQGRDVETDGAPRYMLDLIRGVGRERRLRW